MAATALLVVAGGLVWASLPEPDEAATALPSSEDVGIDPPFGEPVPLDLEFRNEVGQTVQLADLFDGKPVLAAPVYYQCPMLCNLTMDGLVRGLRGLSPSVGEDFTVITVSFEPTEKPPLAAAAKKTAIERYSRPGAAAGWHFLTGEQAAIDRFTEALGFRYKFDETSGQYIHAAGLYVLSPDGKISRFLGGVEFTPRDLKLALSEAAQGETRSLTDQILLLCFHYDPTNGKYGLAILRLLRFAGVVTVGVIGGAIFLMLRREGPATAKTAHPQEEAVDG